MNPETLREISWSQWQPFRLQLGSHSLHCNQCLRLLPGKRMACRAELDGQQVFVKLFFASGHRRQCADELERLRLLDEAGVRVPQLLATAGDETVSMMALEWLSGSSALGAVPVSEWDVSLTTDFAEQLRHMYAAGLLQADLHLDNFLCASGKLFAIDAGAVRHRGRPVSAVERTDNLGLLCAQAPLHDQPLLLRTVVEQLGDQLSSEADLHRCAHRHLMRRIRHANGKWLRGSTAIARHAGAREVSLLDRGLDSDQRQAVNRLMEQPDSGELLKQGSRISVYATAELVVKHYRDTSLKSRLKQRFSMHAAQRSWRAGWTWTLLGIRTPRPLGLRLLSDGSAMLVFPRQPGDRYSEMLEYRRQQADALRPQLEASLEQLGWAQCWHGDAKAQNILVHDNQAHWIDLDASGWSANRRRARRRHARDVKRFAENWVQFAERDEPPSTGSPGET